MEFVVLRGLLVFRDGEFSRFLSCFQVFKACGVLEGREERLEGAGRKVELNEKTRVLRPRSTVLASFLSPLLSGYLPREDIEADFLVRVCLGETVPLPRFDFVPTRPLDPVRLPCHLASLP